MGRVQGEYPLFLPCKHSITSLVKKRAHAQTHHGMVGLTMSMFREHYWTDTLRSQVKRIIYNYNWCKKFSCKPLLAPSTDNKSSYLFETVGLDFAGPIEYKVSKECYRKSYNVLYTCATSRAIHLDLLKTMENKYFRRSIIEMIARKRTPALIISDNAKTFFSTARWIRRLRKDSQINEYLGEMNIKWQFNLARSSWWGGFFERMEGLVKRSLHKATGKLCLFSKCLKVVLNDIENTLNNRPLGYIENDIQLPVLTPNIILHGKSITIPFKNIDDDNREFNEKRDIDV
ncbi:uncharacterized protein LOC101235304 [Hydra vulgaris]|uniref:uncharacterized protein LOC101235304 n=1 Tax=Hydra vulgaris TaxID=6087 RepID=UPI0002B43D9F|nr:uncharacterized protein LOC101235304 [Hydra vulgaris]